MTVCSVPDLLRSRALFGNSAVQTVLRLNTEVLSCVTKHNISDRQEYVLKISSKHELHRVSESRNRKHKARSVTEVLRVRFSD